MHYLGRPRGRVLGENPTTRLEDRVQGGRERNEKERKERARDNSKGESDVGERQTRNSLRDERERVISERKIDTGAGQE
eukprot:1393264-Amorphochlora_amoeboformis.AAC.1